MKNKNVSKFLVQSMPHNGLGTYNKYELIQEIFQHDRSESESCRERNMKKTHRQSIV